MTRNQRRPTTTKLKQKETTTMKTKLTKMIMSSLAFACALVCLAAAMAQGTSATARAEADRHCSVGMLRGSYLCDLRRVQQPRWELRTDSRYARPPLQRRWYDAQYLRHGEHRRHDYLRRRGIFRNLYSARGLHRHPVTGARHSPNFQYIRRAGCTAGLDYPELPRWRWHPRSEQGTAVRICRSKSSDDIERLNE